jgi:outer membrane protein assembly factor BamB
MKVRFFTFITLTLLAGCTSWFSEETYEAPPTELTEFSVEFEADVVWTASAGSGSGETENRINLWLQNGHVFAVDYEGDAYAFDASTGSRIWQQDVDQMVVTGIGGGDNAVYVGTQEGQVFALNEADGSQKWSQTLTSEVLAPVSGNEYIVAARTSDGRVSGLSPETGDILWSYQRNVPLLSLRGASRPVVAGDKVIAGYDNGKLVALSATDGKVIWEKSVAVPRGRTELDRLVDIDADPVVIDDTVYVVTFQGNVAAVDIDTGKINWSREMSSKTGLAAVYSDAVYISDEDGYVWAVQDLSGDALWRQTRLLRRQLTPPAVVGNAVIVGDFEGYLHWISREDGRFMSRTKLGSDPLKAKPWVQDGIAYIYSTDGKISAVRVP